MTTLIDVRIEPKMHDEVRFLRSVDSVPLGALGWIVQEFADRVVGVELEDRALTKRSDGIVDVSLDDLELVARFTG